MPDTRHNVVSDSDNLDEEMWKLKIAENNNQETDDDQQNQYPDRPGEPVCIYYLRNGTCGYGNSCKYNHPTTFSGQADFVQGTLYRDELPQRVGQPDCQFFLKTGSCKFGSACKYHHPRDKHGGQPIQMNSLGLPIRKDEKSCPYYMRTSSCKFGMACKFNHPELSTYGDMVPSTETSVYGGYTSSLAPPATPPIVGGPSPWALSRHPPPVQGPPTYMPVLPPNVMHQGWGAYMGNVGFPTAMVGSTQMPNMAYYVQPGSSTPVIMSEKPDQPDCQHYLRTGNCKYGTSCKYNHPQERNQAAKCAIGPFGLPLRPGFPICGSYSSNGSCKYGTNCKFDHPIMGYYNYPPVFAVQESPLLISNQRGLILAMADNSSPKTSKGAEKLVNSEKIVELHDTDYSEHDDPSTQTSPSYTAPHSGSAQNQSD